MDIFYVLIPAEILRATNLHPMNIHYASRCRKTRISDSKKEYWKGGQTRKLQEIKETDGRSRQDKDVHSLHI